MSAWSACLRLLTVICASCCTEAGLSRGTDIGVLPGADPGVCSRPGVACLHSMWWSALQLHSWPAMSECSYPVCPGKRDGTRSCISTLKLAYGSLWSSIRVGQGPGRLASLYASYSCTADQQTLHSMHWSSYGTFKPGPLTVLAPSCMRQAFGISAWTPMRTPEPPGRES